MHCCHWLGWLWPSQPLTPDPCANPTHIFGSYFFIWHATAVVSILTNEPEVYAFKCQPWNSYVCSGGVWLRKAKCQERDLAFTPRTVGTDDGWITCFCSGSWRTERKRLSCRWQRHPLGPDERQPCLYRFKLPGLAGISWHNRRHKNVSSRCRTELVSPKPELKPAAAVAPLTQQEAGVARARIVAGSRRLGPSF